MTDTPTTQHAGAQHITDADFESIVLKSDKPVLVDFYAEWCGPCKMAAPIIDKLSDEFAGKVKIVKVDTDQSEKASSFGIMSIPTVLAFKDGKEIDRQIGFGGEDKYREMITKVLAA
jgi:thioredoxin 1